MSNYRRLISYIYAYEGGVKGKNIGFAKIEIRNGQCRIHVNVKRVFLGNSDIGVYLLSPQKEILLGRIFIRNGVGEFRVNVNASDVENSGCSMEQCYGLTIHETESTWRTYTTIWEDAVTQAAEVDLAEVTADKMRKPLTSENFSSVSEEIQGDLEQEAEQIESRITLEEMEKVGIPSTELKQDNDERTGMEGGETRQELPGGGRQRDTEGKEVQKGKMQIQGGESQGREVQGKEAQAGKVQSVVTQGREVQAEEAQSVITQGREAQAGETQNVATQDREAQAGKEQTKEIQSREIQTGEISAGESENSGQAMTQRSESSRGEATADPNGWKRGTPVSAVLERTEGAEKESQIFPEEAAGGNAIGDRSEGVRNMVGNITGSAMTENSIWQGKDSVSEKVLRIARAFVQGKGQTDPVAGPQTSVSRQAAMETHQIRSVPSGTRMAKNPANSVPGPGDPARLAELDRQEQEEMERGNVWRQMQRRYPKVLAFDYANGCEILTIKPQDIGMLPRENWVYGNNSFLLHGYYNYRHLILAKLENPGGEPRYLLGVPGHYYSNEKNLASMFGFPNFVLARKQPEQDGRFGYWYTDLRL
jgi:hypothetical protein